MIVAKRPQTRGNEVNVIGNLLAGLYKSEAFVL